MLRALCILPVAACNQLLDTPEVHRGVCDRNARFSSVAPVDGLDDQLGVQRAQLSADERTVVFSRLTVAGPPDAPVARHGDLYIALRDHRGDPFQAATVLDAVNSERDEAGASLSVDQETLYFDRSDPATDATDAMPRYRIYAATRAGPTSFAVPIAVDLRDADGSNIEPYAVLGRLYFASRRTNGSSSLFVADGRGTSFATPQQLGSIELQPAPTAYEDPVVSADERTLYFSAPPLAGGPADIWTTSRPDPAQPFGTPHVVTELDTSNVERPTWISQDGCRLYFVTNRTGQGLQLWMAARSAP